MHFLFSKRTRVFLIIWLGQFLSIIGSGMTSFVLGIWVFQRHSSTGQFSTVVLAASLPGILMGPFAGAFVDKWDKRKTMILAVVGQAVATLVLSALFATNRIESYWQVYPAIILIAVCGAFQWPALSAACAVLVPKEHYSQAGALWQLNQAAVMIASPMLAAALLPFAKIEGIVLFDAATYVFALGSLFFVRIPNIEPSGDSDDADASRGKVIAFLREVSQGFRYIKVRPALLRLLVYTLYFNIVLDMVQIVVMPLAIKDGTPTRLASIMAASAFGMVAGSMIMAVWSGPKKKIFGVLLSGTVLGAALVIAGPQQNPIWLGASFFLFAMCIPMGLSSAGAIWLSKTAHDVLGRVTATTTTMAQLCFPVACVIAPFLTDRLFTPLLLPDGALASTAVGALFGVGPQRGVGLLLTAMGLTTIVLSIAAFASPRLRLIEDELPEMSTPPIEVSVPEASAAPGLVLADRIH
jgi:MFS transporter, DHA3 family, macrolide efflux protein